MAKPQTKWAKKMGGSHGQGRTPLHRAAIHGRFEVTLALLQEVGHHVQHEGCHSWYTTFGYTSYVDEHMDCGYVDMWIIGYFYKPIWDYLYVVQLDNWDESN